MLGFTPPLYLTPLAKDDARALLARGRFAAEEVEMVVERTACHPFLLQLIASRLFESRDLAATLDQVAADEMVSNFFAVDYQTLDGEERAALEEVSREGPRNRADVARALSRPDDAVEALLFGLGKMGYLARRGAATAWATGSSTAGCGGWRWRGRPDRPSPKEVPR
jgi:hypothetical protein